jgi:sigma-E factor negative regulatory protein RseC
MNQLKTANDSGIVTAQGVVLKVEAPYLWVLTQRQGGGCSGCHAQSSCGTSTLAKLFTKEHTVPLKVQDRCQAQKGDVVELELKESELIQHSLMAYGVPLLGLFIGALTARGVQHALLHATGEWMFIAGAILGMGLGWWGVKRFYHPALPVATRVVKASQ